MGVPRQLRWLVATAAILGALVLLGILAMDQKDVVWADGKPHCPHCRADAHWYASRCSTCREQFDWVEEPEEHSPYCVECLTPGEDEWLRQRGKGLGEEAAVQRVAAVLHVDAPAAREWLRHLGAGQCGWCGGSGIDLAAGGGVEPPPCPACLGAKKCIACGGDRRVTVGSLGAGVAGDRYRLRVTSLAGFDPPEAARKDLRAENEAFLKRHLGTREAADLVFWPRFLEPGGGGTSDPPRSARTARQRLESVAKAMRGD